MTTRIVREWFSPGIIINLVGLLIAAGTTIGVYMHRADVTDAVVVKLENSTAVRFQRMEDRMDRMQRDGEETIRLQEQVGNLKAEIERLDRVVTGQADVAQARYDSLNTRLARKGL